ncbi:MAG: hypothetical protein Q7Q73_09270 [Verrucomicrobiota bacterium JB024]|nr:hypothetical protein [Verrucomicrobiota bacterium JB024]
MPVYVEPIMFSGERITVAVAVVTEGEAPRVVGTLNLEQLEQVFGRHGKDLHAVATLVIRDLQAFLASGGDLEGWTPNLQGVCAGNVVPTKNTSLKAIITSALSHSSLFSAKGLKPSDQTEKAERSLSRFQTQIRDLVLATRSTFAERFNRQMPLYKGKGKAQITYVGHHLAMNLTALDTTISSHSQQRDKAHRKIFQLLSLQESWADKGRDSLIIGVWTPSRDYSPKQNETLVAYTEELEYSATKVGVQCILADGRIGTKAAAQPFAERILADQ